MIIRAILLLSLAFRAAVAGGMFGLLIAVTLAVVHAPVPLRIGGGAVVFALLAWAHFKRDMLRYGQPLSPQRDQTPSTPSSQSSGGEP